MQPEHLAHSGLDDAESQVVQALIHSVDRFASDRIDCRGIDAQHHLPDGMRQELAELGLFSLSIPEEWGGAGLSMHAVCEVIDALAVHDRSVATTVGLHLGLGTRGLVAYGSDAQKERLLPDLAMGNTIAAFAATEPGAGSDLKRISSKVQRDQQGLRLDGCKIFVTNGGFADLFTLLVSSPGLGGARRGQSLVWVDREQDGVVVGAEEDKLGLRGSSTVTLNLDEVRLTDDHIIGKAGTGSAQAAHVLSWGRTAMASGCVGTCRAALRATTRHAATRVQFGMALHELPVVRSQLATMAAHTWAAKALVRHTTHTHGADLVAWSTSAKVLCSRTSWAVCDMAVQLHGGSGFIEETGVALLLRDTRVTRIFEGANDVLLGHAGASELVAARNIVQAEPGPLSHVNDLIQVVAETAHSLRTTHGMRLLRRPRLLHRFGEMVVLRDAAIAAVWRAQQESTESATANAALFLHYARNRMTGLRSPQPSADLIEGVVHTLIEDVQP